MTISGVLVFIISVFAVTWMLWGSVLFLSSVGGETAADALIASVGLAFLVTGTIVALLWINVRYDLVAVEA